MQNFDWPIRVYYEDTDAGGVVYHARYLAFYERARTEILRQLGISQQSLLSQHNIAFVVKKMSIDYVYPARLDDLLIVCSQIDNIKRASLLFKQKIIDQSGRLYSEAEVVIACVDLNKKKPCVFPAFFISEFYKWKI
ncbi:acyl-CoA thioester hydrolase [Orbus hercynius]|uniref:Acyl-CoA thioester hydrolase n=1 Tax=Orbus hercynius TaxID=593135 RepID=A0A495RKK2_9GAMM|nr:tol-pal system-associated acyl-CoA thioesterase [Orbus hercynius]RKS87834.1 acyl-CoA thioester hydrolase [Orbus hercynius]